MKTRTEQDFEQILTKKIQNEGQKVFRQFWIARSRADVVACSDDRLHVFEIKSDVDNLNRLPSQIANYYKGADMVSVFTNEQHLKGVKEILSAIECGKYVGIYCLTEHNQIELVRYPQPNTKALESDVLFKMLRKKEYTDVVQSAFGEIEDIPQVFYFREYLKKFRELPKEKAYAMVAKTLAKR